MADRRTTISIDVIGLADLQAANTAMARHNTLVQRLTAAYQGLNAITGSVASGLTSVNTTFNNTNTTINNTSNTVNKLTMNLGGASNAFQGMLPRLLAYRAVSLVFEGVAKSIQQATEAMLSMERQTARVQRVSTPGSSPFIKAGIAEEVARTGADIKDVGEAFYQFQTRLGDTTTALGATRTALNLVVGTEGDARDVSRAMLQIVSQFPDAFGKSTSEVEKYRRAGELLAITFKDSAAETTELVQALKYLGPIAEATKIPLEQVTGVITALTAEGQRGRMAGTEAAQFVAQIVRNYNQELQGVAGKGQFKDLVFHYKLVEDGTGKIDLLETLKGIVATAKSLPADKAREFLTAISGSQNAFRFLGTTGVEMLQRMAHEIEKDRQALHGMTDDSEKLRKDMTTTAVEFQRAWGGAITSVSGILEASGIRQYFKGIADDIERIAAWKVPEAQAAMRESQAFSGQRGVRAAVTYTSSAVEEALANIDRQRHHPSIYDFTIGLGRTPLGIATEGMSAAATADIQHRYGSSNPLAFLNEDQMRRDAATMRAQLANPRFGLPTGPLAPANPFSIGRAVPNPITDKPDSSDQAAKDAADKRREAARSLGEAAQINFELMRKRFGRDDPRTIRAAQTSDALAKMAAQTMQDPADARNQITRLQGGLTGDVASLDKERQAAEKQRLDDMRQAHEDAVKEHAAATEYYAERAQAKYGLFSLTAQKRAQEAQAAAEDAAKLAGGGIDLQKLRDHEVGPLANYRKNIADALAAGANPLGVLFSSDPRIGVPDMYASGFAKAADARVRARQLGQSAPDAASLKADAADIQGVIDSLTKMGITTQTVRDMLDQFRGQLQDTNAQLAALGERTAQEATAKLFSDAADKYSKKLSDLDNASLPGVGETPRQAAARERAALANRLDFANRQFAEISGLSSLLSSFLVGAKESPEGKKDLENADIARKQAAAALARFDREQAITRYEAAHGPVAQGAQGAAFAFLSGRGSPADVFKSLGNSIVDTALQQWSKKLTDPLVNVTTKQVLAIQDNTKALGTLNDSMTGTGSGTLVGTVKTSGGDLGGVIVAGLALGAALSGGQGLGGAKSGAHAAGTKAGRHGGSSQSDLEKGISAASAAYSIGSNSAQQGVNAGNLIGAALTGFSIGGPIGAGVGVLADLFGGLFHKRNKPTATPQDLNPSFYNAPSGMELAAYNYSAYGKLPTMQNVGFDVKPANTPIVQVFVDGARVAAQTVISNHLSSVNVSLANTNMNRHIPI